MAKRNPTAAEMAAAAKGVRELPNNVEAEQALLGALLVNNGAMGRVNKFLEAGHLFEPIHRQIFEVTSDLIVAGHTVNPVTIKTFLPKELGSALDGMTVPQYLARLAAESVTVINAGDYGRAIHDLWWRRGAIEIAEGLINEMYDMPPHLSPRVAALPHLEALLKHATKALDDDTRQETAGTRYITAMREAKARGSVRGVPFCLPELGKVLSEPCFEAGNYYGLLSSSGEGKTSLTVQIMLYALKMGHPVLMHSFDQSAVQIVQQMVAQEYEIEARRQKFADISVAEMADAEKFAEQINVWERAHMFKIVECSANETAERLVSITDDWVKRYRGRRRKSDTEVDMVPLIVTDHIASIESTEDKRADAGAKAKSVNKVIKAGARRLDVPWLMLNQRNTYGMQRDNPRPIAGDLHGGEGAKQAYDAIVYLYRFKKFYEDRAATATERDEKKLNAIFPEAVRNGSADIAELGSVKVRFGDPHIRATVDFQARFTRYKSLAAITAQEQSDFEGFT